MLSYYATLVCSCHLLPNRIISRKGQLLTSFHNFFLVAKRGLPTYIQNMIMWYFTVQRRQFLWTSLTLLQTHWRWDFNVFHLQPSVLCCLRSHTEYTSYTGYLPDLLFELSSHDTHGTISPAKLPSATCHP